MSGAAGGLGSAIAERLAAEGYRLALLDLEGAALADLAARLPGSLAIGTDLAREGAAESAHAVCAQAAGLPDLLVNCAGIALPGPAIAQGWQDWERVMAVNARAAFFLSTAFARPLLAAERPGVIVNIASTHALVGLPGRAIYGASKAALLQMGRMLAIEWAGKIRVNAVAPGTVLTPSRQQMLADPAARAGMLARIPAGRFVEPSEIAGAVAWLASEAAASMTGQVLTLDGGTTAA